MKLAAADQGMYFTPDMEALFGGEQGFRRPHGITDRVFQHGEEEAVITQARCRAMEAAWEAAWSMAPAGTEWAVEDTIIGLTVYEQFGYLIDSDVQEVAVMARLGAVPAQLLLGACWVKYMSGLQSPVDQARAVAA